MEYSWSRMIYLGRLLRATDETKESAERAQESKKDGNKRSTSLRLSLECANGINLDVINERQGLEAEPLKRSIGELDRINLILGGRLLRLLSITSGLLESVLDVESLLGKFLGLLDRMSNVDIVKEDVLSHGPELKTNATLKSMEYSY